MNYSPESTTKHTDQLAEPLAGDYVASAALPGKADLFDWVELMEVVEVLCPVWPVKDDELGKGDWRL